MCGVTALGFISLADGSLPMMDWDSHGPSLVLCIRTQEKAKPLWVGLKKNHLSHILQRDLNVAVESLLPWLSRVQRFL